MTEINKLKARTFARLGHGGSIFGMALLDAVQHDPSIAVLSADMSSPAGLDRFKGAYPSNFYNVGIAEQNLVGVSAGLASEGRRVVGVAQACFLSMRSFEQVRQYGGYMGWPIVLVGISSGFALTFFGNTHYAIEDMALMRSIPGMTVVAPSDASMAVKAFELALSQDGPVYIRLAGGLNTPVIYTEDFDYSFDRAISLRQGHDIALVATGTMVSPALQIADALALQGVECSVVDMHTVKPLDINTLDHCMSVRLVVTIEEHNVVGGLGGAVAEYMSGLIQRPPLLRIGVEDRFFKPASYEHLIEQSGLSAPQITEKIKQRFDEINQ